MYASVFQAAAGQEVSHKNSVRDFCVLVARKEWHANVLVYVYCYTSF